MPLPLLFSSSCEAAKKRPNIKGNDDRLGVAINYHDQILLMIWLGTHQEYDRIDVVKVASEKERYADSSNSN